MNAGNPARVFRAAGLAAPHRGQRVRTSESRRAVIAWLAVALVALGCAKARRAPERQHGAASTDELERVLPAEVGLKPEVLAGVVMQATRDEHADLASVLVARNGCLALEEYFNGVERASLHDVRSVAKSVTGTLVGIALQNGAIASLDTPAMSFFPRDAERDRTPRAGITVGHLLEMRSGLDADDWRDSPQSLGTETRMEAASDRTLFALGVPMAAAPGERWQYSSVNTLLLGRIVERVTGRDLEAYAREKLFAPLGFGHYEWRRDARGDVVPQGNLRVRALDLLKFGLLFENGGRWHGRQWVPEAWVREATRARSELPPDAATGLGDLYRGYGYHWWTSEEPTASGPRAVYFASGNGGQKLFVVPSARLVMVTTSSAYNQRYAHRRAHELFRAILVSVDEGSASLRRCGAPP